MEFRVARAARITGEMLERLVRTALTERGVQEPDAVVCYGAGYNGPKPTLNAACSSMDKMQQGQKLRTDLGLRALNVQPASEVLTTARVSQVKRFPIPLIARKTKHAKGKDIRVCRTPKGLEIAIARGRDFITPLVDSDTEYRVWVYRKRVLCVYEKRLTEPENNVKFGRNRANGWTFHQLPSEEIAESVRQAARDAVKALNLDFGAVDILGKWNAAHTEIHPTVLEVNSAPGVSDEHRSAIVKLVHRIVRWVEVGCPAREAQ